MSDSTSMPSCAHDRALPCADRQDEALPRAGRQDEDADRIRSEWAASFVRSTLGHWLTASAAGTGLFNPFLDRAWTARAVDRRTLVSQSRLIYNFSRGFDITGESRYADAAALGIEALDRHFHRGNGAYRWSVLSDGSPGDDSADSYGHAFVILALSSAAHIFAGRPPAERALEAWRSVRSNLSDAHGGLIWRMDAQPDRSQNPLMHSFEALMALHAVDPTGFARAEAERLLAFMHTLHDFSAGRLIENFHADWSPLPWQEGGALNLGHALEWAFLLSEWHGITGDSDTLALGERFLETGLAWAVDGGGVRESCDSCGGRVVRTSGLWQQCEAIRAVHRYMRRHGRDDLGGTLDRLVNYYRCNFVDPQYGGAFAGPAGPDGPMSMHKGDDWKLDYHTVNMCIELI